MNLLYTEKHPVRARLQKAVTVIHEYLQRALELSLEKS